MENFATSPKLANKATSGKTTLKKLTKLILEQKQNLLAFQELQITKITLQWHQNKNQPKAS